MVRTALALLVMLCAAAPAAAQQRQVPDTTRTPEQRALDRLRNLRAVAEPDSLRPRTDSVPARAGRLPQAPTVSLPNRIQRDSIMEALLGIEGYQATEYQGGEARYDADSSRLVLRGAAQVARQGNQLAADSSITYDEKRALACGYGQPVLVGEGMSNPVVSDTVCYDIERQMGRAPGATTRIEQGAQWNVRCDAYFAGDDLYCHDAIFSDCDLPYPHQHYHFAAGELKVVRGNVMVARDLTLKFEDVPVMWLPFMVQSLTRGRRSGILTPRFGINDIARNSSRYNRRIEDVGVYWAINEYMGAEVALDWFSENWTSVRGSLDYIWNRRFLRGGLTYRRYWREEGGSEFTLASQNSWQVDERTQVTANANYTTSSQFVRSRSLDPRELNRSVDSNASLRRRFDWGNLSLGANRKQFLSDNTVSQTLPSMGITVSPITLFEALPGEEQWYSNTTWSGSVDFRMETRDIGAENLSRVAQSTEDLTARATSSIAFGNLSIGQNFTYDNDQTFAREVPGDTVLLLPGQSLEKGAWSTNLSYQQRLIGTSTFTPGISIQGGFARRSEDDATGDTLGINNTLVTAPVRIDFNAGLQTDLFGFYPGAGPFQRLRHRVSPSVRYNYSPEVTATEIQRGLFGNTGADERNQIALGLSQTWEAKYHDVATDTASAAQDSAAAAEADAAARDGEPRRRQQTRTVQLLSITTDAVMYDFVEAREGDGITTAQISNNVTSELLRGLSLNFTHDLWETPEAAAGEQPGGRTFSPHLARVTANFSLNGDSWLFRILKLGRSDTLPARTDGSTAAPAGEVMAGGPAVDGTQSEGGMIGGSRRNQPGMPRGRVGEWSANFNYSLARPRDVRPGLESNQMVTADFRFQPTVNWGMTWRTGYSFTTGEFTDHYLTLTRTLHDWDANFDFVKAQNGNFSFQFRVHLRANPDIKLDYQQADMPGVQRSVRQR